MFTIYNNLKNFTITLGIETINIFLLDTNFVLKKFKKREIARKKAQLWLPYIGSKTPKQKTVVRAL